MEDSLYVSIFRARRGGSVDGVGDVKGHVCKQIEGECDAVQEQNRGVDLTLVFAVCKELPNLEDSNKEVNA